MENKVRKVALIATLTLITSALAVQAHARPPTVQNSPGYERALKESRANYLRAASPEPVAPARAKKKPKAKSKNQT